MLREARLRAPSAGGTARWRRFDWVLLAATLMLALFGILMIYSATSEAGPFAPSSFVVRQAAYLAFGLVAMVVAANVDYRFLQNWTWVMYGGVVVLLGLVYVLGTEVYGSTRWIDLGPVPIQPSEPAKLLMVFVLARFLSDQPRSQSSPFRFLASLGLVLVPVGLVFGQPDLGTSLVLAAVWLSMVLVSGTRPKYFAWLALLCVPVVVLAWRYVLKPYQVARVFAFIDPSSAPLDDGYNIIQATTAVGAGGMTGRGWMQGSQSQLQYLRVQHTDFIASVIGEEFGFLGMVALLLVYGLVLWRVIRVASLARDQYGELIAVGIGSIILFQAFVNIGMNVRLMPVTGIPLPFVSSGGSSLVTLLAAEGVLQSILLRHKKVDV